MGKLYNKYKSSTEKKDWYAEMTNKVIEKLEAYESNLEKDPGWDKPWFTANEMPFNPETGTRYKGINAISLLTAGFEDPRFLTYKNVQDMAERENKPIHVKKGAQGFPVFKAVQISVSEKNGSDVEVQGDDGQSKTFWRYAYAGTVFNASQIDGIEPYHSRKEQPDFKPVQEAETLVKAMCELDGLSIKHSTMGRAYYQPSAHLVHMPEKEMFKSDERYYDTLLHELGHSTGKALGRDLTGGKGSAAYAKEELVAELSSVFTSAQIGIPHNPGSHEQHASYIKSWLGALKDDKKFIFSASTKAAKATEYQLEKLETYKLNHGLNKEATATFDDLKKKMTQSKSDGLAISM